MVRHEGIAKQADRAKHQADDAHGRIQQSGDNATALETRLLRHHRHCSYDPSLTWVCIPSFLEDLQQAFRPLVCPDFSGVE